MGRRRRILITGGCGLIGTILRKAFAPDYDVSCLCQSNPEEGCSAADITDLHAIEGLFRGMDVVIHLAADSKVEATWDSVYSNNILGTYNVFEASRRGGVKRVIFASSNHVTGLYEEDEPISSVVRGLYEPGTSPRMIDHATPPRPDSLYGVSKLFGEGLGQHYSAAYGLSVICLRIGSVVAGDDPRVGAPRYYATWLSHRDLIQLVERCIEVRDVKFEVFYGVSNNARRFWDISHARDVLGYSPLDNAEGFRKTNDGTRA